jgi:hypothetical protein
MMNGSKKILGLAVAGVTLAMLQLYYNNKNQKPNRSNFIQPTETQLRNRLEEFFTDDSLAKAQGKYDTMIKMGWNAKDAYRILGCSV